MQVGDLLNAIIPALEADGWEIVHGSVGDDGLRCYHGDLGVEITFERVVPYTEWLAGQIAREQPIRDRHHPENLRLIESAVAAYDAVGDHVRDR